MGAGIFITGTGTDVGKTVVTAALLRGLRGRGMDAVSSKPVQSGADATHEGLRAQDLDLHRAAAGLPRASMAEMDRLAPYRYVDACSPHLAGRIAGAYPDLAAMTVSVHALCSDHDAVLIEGAGGVLVPLDERQTMRDLMVALEFPVLVVAHAGLGTINHTLLTVASLRSVGLDVLGVVLCDATPVADDFIKRDNPKAIAQFGAVPILGHVRHRPALMEFDAAAWDAAVADITGLDTIHAALCGGKE